MPKERLRRLLAGGGLFLIVALPMAAIAAEPQAVPPPASTPVNIGVTDRQIGEKLRALIDSKQLDQRIDWVANRKAIEAFYAARDYAPLWLHEGQITEKAKAAIARLRNAASEGLDPTDYPAPDFGVDAKDAADGELMLTNSVLDFARHLAAGRIAPRRVLSEVEYGDHTPDPATILKTVSQADDINAVLDSYDPPDQGFRALKDKLAELRREAADSAGRIAQGPAIRPGAHDARIPALRRRLHVTGNPIDTRYDWALANAISRTQREAHLRPTGIVDAKTIDLINGPSRSQTIETIAANMERWRWLPRDLGHTYVMVNIPDYTLQVVHDRRPVWRTKIVTGKPVTPTPLVSAPMREVIVNPSWTVPQSIIQNELMPAYASDKNIFVRMGLEVKTAPDGRISVVQPPGARNALGRIKFVFPNKFQVYLHDTPEKRLFAYDQRAFSHGCMRVEDPTKFGEIMLSLAMDGRAPSSGQLYSLFGSKERDFRLAKQPIVHVTYQTAFVDDAGRLELRPDIYGFDARIHAILHGDERRIADHPPPPDPKRDLATFKANQDILRRVERREALNPMSYFERQSR